MSRKILISKDYGAGWSTWQSDIPTRFACEYQPIIEALERGEELHEDHPAIIKYLRECAEKFNQEYVCVLGMDGLSVVEIADDAQYQVDEYDGAESIRLASTQQWH